CVDSHLFGRNTTKNCGDPVLISAAINSFPKLFLAQVETMLLTKLSQRNLVERVAVDNNAVHIKKECYFACHSRQFFRPQRWKLYRTASLLAIVLLPNEARRM